MNDKEWEKVDEELDFIIDNAESAQSSNKVEDLNDAINDNYRSLGRIRSIMNGLERN